MCYRRGPALRRAGRARSSSPRTCPPATRQRGRRGTTTGAGPSLGLWSSRWLPATLSPVLEDLILEFGDGGGLSAGTCASVLTRSAGSFVRVGDAEGACAECAGISIPRTFFSFFSLKKKKLPFFRARCPGSVKTNKNCAVRWKNAERCEKRCAYEVPRRKKGARVSLQPYTALALKVGAFRLREEATPERQSAEQCPVAATPRISETGAPEEEGPGGLQVTDPEEIRRSSRRETRRGSASRRLSFLSGHAGSAVGRTVPPAGAGPAASLALTPP